jgi:hypothetical protein
MKYNFHYGPQGYLVGVTDDKGLPALPIAAWTHLIDCNGQQPLERP